MEQEVKEKIYNSYRITVYKNRTDRKEKYYVKARKLFGKANPPKDAIKLPIIEFYGDDPDELIQKTKLEIDNI